MWPLFVYNHPPGLHQACSSLLPPALSERDPPSLPPLTQELAVNNSGVPVSSYHPWPSPNARLAYELDMFEKEYFAMLYGGVVGHASTILSVAHQTVAININKSIIRGVLNQLSVFRYNFILLD